MRDDRVNSCASAGRSLTRRDVLRAAAATTIGVLAGVRPVTAAKQATTQRGGEPSASRPWWLDPRLGRRSRVVDVHSQNVVRSAVADRVVLSELLTHGMLVLTGAASPRDSWRTVLGDAGRIVIKFNSVGAAAINTTDAMARSLVEAISSAGYERSGIELIEAPRHLAAQLGTRCRTAGERGWGPPIRVDGQSEPLSSYVYEADAIINVPFLKTHRIAGMSCCLKNLSHAVIKHPSLYHANACSPSVGQVIRAEAVSSRLKLNVVNAIRIVIDKGPEAAEKDIIGHGGLFLGFDPVAVDAVGLELLANERRRAGLAGGVEVPYLESAARMWVGRRLPQEVERLTAETGS